MADDPEREIEAEVARSNPRRPGESHAKWTARLSAIKSKAVRRYWNDVRALMDETGADADEARKLYRKALDELARERGEVTRDEIVSVVAEAMEEEPEPEEAEEETIWQGDEEPFEMQNNLGSYINARLSAGLHEYAALLWVYRGAQLLGSAEVSFEASPSTFWPAFHDAAREYLLETAYPRIGKSSSVTMHVTEVRVVR